MRDSVREESVRWWVVLDGFVFVQDTEVWHEMRVAKNWRTGVACTLWRSRLHESRVWGGETRYGRCRWKSSLIQDNARINEYFKFSRNE